jgi:hypothetical protein
MKPPSQDEIMKIYGLNIDHLGIWSHQDLSYTLIHDNIKNPISFMPIWN